MTSDISDLCTLGMGTKVAMVLVTTYFVKKMVDSTIYTEVILIQVTKLSEDKEFQ